MTAAALSKERPELGRQWFLIGAARWHSANAPDHLSATAFPSTTMCRRVSVVVVGTGLAFAAIQLFPEDRTRAKLFFAGLAVVVAIIGAVAEPVWKSRSGEESLSGAGMAWAESMKTPD